MGKIIALGGGRYDNGEIINVFEYIVSSTGKKAPKVLFLPTAGFDDIEGDEHIEMNFRQFGCRYEILFLTDKTLSKDTIREKILGADIIYVGGGNVEFMMNTWNETGASVFLKEAYEKGTVMSGLSAGADCWFKESYDDCGEDGAFVFCDCLGILPYCACPHYDSENWHKFSEAVKTRKVSGIALENGAALVYEDGRYSVMCGNEGGNVYFLDVNQNHKEILFDSHMQL